MKRLIIITRIHADIGETIGQNPDEFCKYWKGKTNEPFLDFTIGANGIKVVNGALFYKGANADNEWRKDPRKVTTSKYADLIMPYLKNEDQEIGVIAHCPSKFLLGEEIGGRITVKFSKEYSSVGNTYYKSIYIPLAESCIGKSINNIDLFEKLWNEFAGDPLLEARIHLWKLLTLLGVKIKRGEVNAQKYAKEIETIKGNEKIKNQSEVISLLMDFETIEKYHKKMETMEFYNQLIPEPNPQ